MLRLVLSFFACAVLSLGAACNDGGSDEPDETNEPAPTSAPGQQQAEVPTAPLGDATVFGSVELTFEPYGEGAEAPEGDIAISLLVRPAEGGQVAAHPADGDGAFALALGPGEYEIAGLQITADSMGGGPVLHSTGGPLFSVADSGCVYIGDITYNLYRLPAMEASPQLDLEEELEERDGAEYELLYIPTGGLIQYDASVTEGDVPGDAEDCDVTLAEFVDD
jgi:hypothetical protein